MRVTETQKIDTVVCLHYKCDKCDKIMKESENEIEITKNYDHSWMEIGCGSDSYTETLNLCNECSEQAIQLLIDNGFKIENEF